MNGSLGLAMVEVRSRALQRALGDPIKIGLIIEKTLYDIYLVSISG